MAVKQLSPKKANAAQPATPAKSTSSKPTPSRAVNKKPSAPAGPRPSDDPIAALSAATQPKYKFAFDAAGLESAVDAGPTKEQAAEVFASEVHANMQQDTTVQLAQIDPQFLATIVQAVLAIVQACPKKKVTQALDTCQKRPRSLPARNIKLQLARKLPGPWTFHAVEVARAMIDTSIKDRDTDLFATLFPDPAPVADASSAAASLPELTPRDVPPVTDGPPPAGIATRADDVAPAQLQ